MIDLLLKRSIDTHTFWHKTRFIMNDTPDDNNGCKYKFELVCD